MSTSRNGRSHSRERRDNSRDRGDRDRDRERDPKNKTKRKDKPTMSQRSPSNERNTPRNSNARNPFDFQMNYNDDMPYNDAMPPWQGQFRPPPPRRHLFRPGMIGPGPRMFHPSNFQMPGPIYRDFGNPGYPGFHDYRYETYTPPMPPRDGPRFGENVLEKAENMVNDLAEKRKQAEDRNRKKNVPDRTRSATFTRPESKKEPLARTSSAAGTAPRLTMESWAMATKDLPRPSTSLAPSREISPNRAKPVPKPDVNKVANKSESLSRASIAKLINAPRSHKERQRLASLVKKTKPKSLRPKLNVHAVPEVGSVDSTAPIEVNEILDLVELPENLRLQVEHLLENGPDTGLDTRSPTKSPVAKKAKKDSFTIEDLDEMDRPRQSKNAVTLKQDLIAVVKREPNWDSDSVISDVTSVGQTEDDDETRRPFERLADRVTSDPKLNRILDVDDLTASESDLLDTPRIEAMVHEALGTSPSRRDFHTRDENVFKRPDEPSSKKSTPKRETDVSKRHGFNQSSSTPERRMDTGAYLLNQSPAVVEPVATAGQNALGQARLGDAFLTPSSPMRNDAQKGLEASPSGECHGSLHVTHERLDLTEPKPSTSSEPQRPDSHALSSAANGLATARAKLREMGDALMSLHVAIHSPARQEDTVNLVLDITEREEQLSSELGALDSHAEVLNQLLCESRVELDRLMRLRETVRGDGDILRKQRLDVLRNAVSRKREQNVSSTQNVHQSVTSTSESVVRDEDADRCSLTTENAEESPRSDELTPRFDEPDATTADSSRFTNMRDCTMQYVGTIKVEELESGGIWQRLQQAQNAPDSLTLANSALDKRMKLDDKANNANAPFLAPKIEPLELDDLCEETLPPEPKSRKRKKPKLGVKMTFPSKSKKQTKIQDKLSPKDSKKKNQQRNVLLELCKEMSPRQTETRFSHGAKTSETDSDYDLLPDLPEILTDDVTNDESELDSPLKVKARLLKAVDDPGTKPSERRRSGKLKKDLLKSLDENWMASTSANEARPDPLVQSTLLDHEIAMKLHQCSVALGRLQESKKKKDAAGKRTPVSNTVHPTTVTVPLVTSSIEAQSQSAQEDSVSVVSDAVTNSEVTSSKESAPTKRRKAKRKNEKAKAPPPEYSSNSEYDTDDVPLTLRHATKKKPATPKYPSDSRKEKLRQMGVILSASELDEFCKDGHQLLSDRESSSLDTPRTEDLLGDTPRTLDTARTEDLLRPIQTIGTTSATPYDDSDNYSSCLESIDESRPLQSTADSFPAYSRGVSESGAESVGTTEVVRLSGPGRTLAKGEKASTLDSDYESRERYPESEQSLEGTLLTDRSERSVASDTTGAGTDRSERDFSGQYEKRIKEILCESSSDADLEVKGEQYDDDDDVVILGEFAPTPPTTTTTTAPQVQEPTSARSDKSLPAFGHKKQKFVGHLSAVTSMVIFENHLYTCSPQDSTIRKFSLETSECLHVFKRETNSIYTMLALEYDGKSYLYTGGYDSKLVKYDLATHESLNTQTLPAKVRCLLSRWDRVFIGLCSGEIVSMSPENDTYKSLVCSGKSVSCMDTGIEGSRHVLVVGSFDPLISIHDAKNGLLLRTISSHSRVPLSVKTFHNNIFSAGADKCIKQHDLNSGELIKSIQLHHPVTDLLVHQSSLYVACFDGLIRCFNRELELQRLYYGAGKNYLLRLGVVNDLLFSTNKNGHVECMPVVEDICYMCQSKNCRLGFGLISDLEYHVTEKHVESRLDNRVAVYYCTWIGCCFETQKRMDLENHLLNHVENLMNDD